MNEKWYDIDVNLRFCVQAGNYDEAIEKINEILNEVDNYNDMTIDYIETIDRTDEN